MVTEKHKHVFASKEIQTNLHAYKRQSGEVEMVKVNTARDLLRQRVCVCGILETYDLTRKKL